MPRPSKCPESCPCRCHLIAKLRGTTPERRAYIAGRAQGLAGRPVPEKRREDAAYLRGYKRAQTAIDARLMLKQLIHRANAEEVMEMERELDRRSSSISPLSPEDPPPPQL